MENKRLPSVSEITDDMIQEWKAKYGENMLTKIEIEDDEGRMYPFIVRAHDRSTTDAVVRHGAAKDYTAANKVVLSNLILAGDVEAIQRDGELYKTLLHEIQKTARVFTAKSKKL